jgi:hypothetical protein
MVAHIRTSAGLHVTFERGDREYDSEIASTPERALKAALMMLARLDELVDGDRLTCVERK